MTAVETSAKGRLNETLVKRLTGGDMIAARNLYSNKVVEFRPTSSSGSSPDAALLHELLVAQLRAAASRKALRVFRAPRRAGAR
ncbi:MAG: hypothetical protein QOI02_1311 [Actinomycetota bacterium]|nr:hypothetical protein [Actinomycetota bacterium]